MNKPYRRRRRTGHFAQANRGGPGRPPKPAPPNKRALRLRQIVDPHALLLDLQITQDQRAAQRTLDALLNRHAEEAWRVLQKTWPRKDLIDLALRAARRRLRLPPFIRDLIKHRPPRRRPK